MSGWSKPGMGGLRSLGWLGAFPLLSLLLGCGGPQSEDGADLHGEGEPSRERWEGDVAAATRVFRPQGGTDADWDRFFGIVSEGWTEGVDTLPMGDAVLAMGLSLLGTPYVPGTLEVAGEEDVVVNLQGLDCVTLVENALAMARFLKTEEPEILHRKAEAKGRYIRRLGEIRYRGGEVDGYTSRLHYFSDWIRDNEVKGIVEELTPRLGGEEDREAIDFMTTHPEAYRQLQDPGNLVAMKAIEDDLSAEIRYRLSQAHIPTWSSWIRDGDIIAATSTVQGLDVAHTGLAYWKGTELHLLHAPLVGQEVEVSRMPLADRVRRLGSQDGIRVVRPVEPGGPED